MVDCLDYIFTESNQQTRDTIRVAVLDYVVDRVLNSNAIALLKELQINACSDSQLDDFYKVPIEKAFGPIVVVFGEHNEILERHQGIHLDLVML